MGRVLKRSLTVSKASAALLNRRAANSALGSLQNALH
jgi:hypothetical protein